ncbi:MAG: carbamoyltransferase N-terminal domain-containing protein [Tangfeifania sp.]
MGRIALFTFADNCNYPSGFGISSSGAETLYYTGGSALNIVANTRTIESGIFREVFIPSCTEDSCLALGTAAFAEWKKTRNGEGSFSLFE